MGLVFQSSRVFASRVTALRSFASERTIRRAMHNAGIGQRFLADRRAFLPYGTVASFIDHVARDLGDPCIGARTGSMFLQQFPASVRRYISSAPTLREAVARSAEVLLATNSGATLRLSAHGDNAAIDYDSALGHAMGSAQLEQAIIAMMIDLFRRFHGEHWTPVRVEIPQAEAGLARGIGAFFGQDLEGCPSDPLESAPRPGLFRRFDVGVRRSHGSSTGWTYTD